MTSALDSLPPELLDNIIGQLDNDLVWDDYLSGLEQHRRQLLFVSSVSRKLRQACDPYVFRVFPSTSNREPTRPFLRSLCERPHLSKYVRKVWMNLEGDGASVPSADDCKLFTAAMAPFAIYDWHQSVLTALLNGCHKAESFLLFALCNKLRELRLGVNGTFNPLGHRAFQPSESPCQHCNGFSMAACIASLLERSAPRIYQDLTTVEVNDCKKSQEDSGSPATSGLSGPLLKLPRLEKLDLSHCHISDLEDVTFSLAGRKANKLALLMLKLEDCEVESDQVAILLQSCRALRVVTVTWKEEKPMNVSTLFAGLKHHHASIQYLELGNYGRVDIGNYGDGRPSVDSLKGFKKLRTLDINDSLLIGNSAWDAPALTLPTFPANLGSLKLHTQAPLGDLGCILAALQPQMTANRSTVRLSFPVSEENAQYVEMIHATDLAPQPRSLKRDSPWTIHLSRGDGSSLFIVLCFWKLKTKPIAKTFHELSEELADVGIIGSLERHFEGWEINEDTAELLEKLREIVRMAWPVEE